jgi:hypothetical protein
MLTVGWAFAWEMWRASRFALLLALTYLLGLAVLVYVLPAAELSPERIGAMTIPLWLVGLNLLALLTHAESADLLARESGFPRRTLARPLRTVALAGWPMALGTTAVVLFWLAVAGLVLRPAGLPAPLLWPAVFLAALLAWGQALMWFPFPLPCLRLLVAVPILGGMTIGAVLGQTLGLSPALLLALSAGLVPLAYVTADVGVERARRGDTPVWSWRLPQLRTPAAATDAPFSSPAAALFWLEWRRHGLALPLMVGLMLMALVALLTLDARARQPDLMAGAYLSCLVLFPPLMAAGAGAFLGNCHPWSRQVAAVPAFSAARPVTTAALIAVKVWVAVATALLTWGLAYLATLALVLLSPVGNVLVQWARDLIDGHGAQGAVLLVLIVLGPLVLSAKQLVSYLWIGLTGRLWVGVAVAVACPVAMVAATFLFEWVAPHGQAQPERLAALPRVLALLLPLKLVAGLLIARALLRRRLVAPGTVARFGVGWVIGAAAAFGLSYWLVPAEVYSPFVAGCAAVVLGLPLVRLGLAPLALDWNRHR